MELEKRRLFLLNRERKRRTEIRRFVEQRNLLPRNKSTDNSNYINVFVFIEWVMGVCQSTIFGL
jgi:hypothetical protein